VLIDLEDLYRRNLDFVFRICSRYTGSKSDAEDLTQEAFLKASRRLAEFRGESECRTWLYRVTVNTCMDYLRKRKRECRNLGEFLDDMVVKNLDDDGGRIQAKLELERILGHIRPKLRTILFMTLAEGLTYAETAEVMNLSAAAVAKSVERFLKRFRKKNPGSPRTHSAPKEIRQYA
jgi:RNA polymerase sigma-70 factor (ECF subfamily)